MVADLYFCLRQLSLVHLPLVDYFSSNFFWSCLLATQVFFFFLSLLTFEERCAFACYGICGVWVRRVRQLLAFCLENELRSRCCIHWNVRNCIGLGQIIWGVILKGRQEIFYSFKKMREELFYYIFCIHGRGSRSACLSIRKIWFWRIDYYFFS